MQNEKIIYMNYDEVILLFEIDQILKILNDMKKNKNNYNEEKMNDINEAIKKAKIRKQTILIKNNKI